VVDVAREPRWGRVEETYGDVPYLVSRMGIATVRGFQGDAKFRDKKRLIATLKHLAGHGQPESGMNCAPANVSLRVLRETFLYTFKEALKKGGAISVMASYSELDGVPSHANTWLLQEVLRKEWGFKGFIVSDYFAICANFIFQFMIALQLDFYTHIFGLTPAQAGTLFLVVGLGAAAINPIMGLIADRTTTRWGKFRPWLLWTAVPFGIIGILTFTTPNINPGAKLIYAWVTYTLLRVVYIVNNVPYASLTAVMTQDPDERTSISSYRQIAANSAGFIIASLAIPMVAFFGHGNDAHGYQLTMGLLSLVSVVFFIITFFVTKERIQPDPQQKSSLTQSLSDLFQNRPWGRAVPGHAVLFRRHPRARQRHAVIFPIRGRRCKALRVV
jgi:hypothetical protein